MGMGWAHHAVPALEFGQRGSSRELEPMVYWLEGDTQKRWSKANLQVSIELAAVAMGNKSKPELKLMPMRSDERLAQRIAEEFYRNTKPAAFWISAVEMRWSAST